MSANSNSVDVMLSRLIMITGPVAAAPAGYIAVRPNISATDGLSAEIAIEVGNFDLQTTFDRKVIQPLTYCYVKHAKSKG